jgi:dolichol kinase
VTTTQNSDQARPLRKLIHLAGAVFPLLYLFFSKKLVLIVSLNVLVIVAAIELGRRQWPAMERAFEQILGPALRSGEERKPTTGIWSMVAIVFSIIVFDRAIAIAGMFFAQVGDPAAEVAGRRWGRHHWRRPGGKTIEGSLGCFVAGVAVGLLCSLELAISPSTVVAGALVATLVEAAPRPVSDNLFMAPIACLAMTLVASISG